MRAAPQRQRWKAIWIPYDQVARVLMAIPRPGLVNSLVVGPLHAARVKCERVLATLGLGKRLRIALVHTTRVQTSPQLALCFPRLLTLATRTYTRTRLAFRPHATRVWNLRVRVSLVWNLDENATRVQSLPLIGVQMKHQAPPLAAGDW